MEVIYKVEEIADAAKKLLAMAGKKKLIAFHGEMGAGKTTLIHALGELLHVVDGVNSPTFSIINQYATATGEMVFHIDLYRLKNEQEAYDAGVEECLHSGNYCFVEWPDKMPAIFPANTLHVSIEAIGNNLRKLRINL